MTHLVDQLLGVPPVVAYLVIALLVFAEAAIFVGFVLPGETAVILGGVLAASGRLSLGWLLVLVVCAAIVGDTVGYEVGKHLGPRVLRWRVLGSQQERLDAARRGLRRRGGIAVFLGRFTAFLRAAMPALAGVSRMPYGRFLAWNAAGGIAWGVGVTLLGYFAGASYQKVQATLGKSSAVLLGVLVLAALVGWRLRRRAQRREETRSDAEGG
jgi:membrane protein DedA with SNARE-associated domain